MSIAVSSIEMLTLIPPLYPCYFFIFYPFFCRNEKFYAQFCYNLLYEVVTPV